MKTAEERLISCIDYLTKYIANKNRKSINTGSYPYIPFNFTNFTRVLNFVKDLIKTDYPTFIDYGCGVGVTCNYASQLGFITHGIEYDKELISPYSDYIIKVGNLEDEDLLFSRRQLYDVVYYWSPFTDFKKEIIFETRALETVKVGGYVISPSPGKAFEIKKYGKNYCKESKLILQILESFKIAEPPKGGMNYEYPILKRIK